MHLILHNVKFYLKNYRQYTAKKWEQLEGESLNTFRKLNFRTIWSKEIPREFKIKFYPREFLF